MEGDEGPSALSSLAQNMTTCFMNWISDFFPNTVNKVYKILHCITEFITLINNVQIVFQYHIRQFPFTTATGDGSSWVSSWSAGSHLPTNGVQPSWKQVAKPEIDDDSTVTQNSAFLSDAMPKLSYKMYPLDEATLKCAMQNTTYVLENLKAT
jgi:hypothetical protein